MTMLICWYIQAVEKHSIHEKKMPVVNSSLKLTASNTAAVSTVNSTPSVRQQQHVVPGNSSSAAAPFRVNSTNTR